MLQLKDLRVGQWEEPCIRANTRELDRELCTGLSTLYPKLQWSTLNNYIFALRSTYILHVV